VPPGSIASIRHNGDRWEIRFVNRRTPYPEIIQATLQSCCSQPIGALGPRRGTWATRYQGIALIAHLERRWEIR